MAGGDGSGSVSMAWRVLAVVFMLMVVPAAAQSTQTTGYYDAGCPLLELTVKLALLQELKSDFRLGASFLRLMFHDCFVGGCDASVFLDDTATFTGEKTAQANFRSLRPEAFSAFDRIKAAVEGVCPGVVSCADIIVLLARDGVVLAGGPSWYVELGRKDSLSASLAAANSDLPLANMKVDQLIATFAAKGLSASEMVTLSGSHTFGKAQCPTFSFRLYNFNGVAGASDPSLDPGYAAILEQQCPNGGPPTTVVNLDQGTPTTFDNSYYTNLLVNKGLLGTDQTLESDSTTTAATVNAYAANQNQFFSQFSAAMVKMGNLGFGSGGEIRTNCRVPN